MDLLETLRAAHADPEAARLVVRRVRGRRDLAVAAATREPGFDVVLLRSACAEIAGGNVDDSVRECEYLHQLLLDLERQLLLVAPSFGRAEQAPLGPADLDHRL